MRKLLSLMMGVGIGGAVGAVIVMLFAPTSGDQFIKNLKRGWAETMDEARAAREQRRQELEAELARIRSQ